MKYLKSLNLLSLEQTTATAFSIAHMGFLPVYHTETRSCTSITKGFICPLFLMKILFQYFLVTQPREHNRERSQCEGQFYRAASLQPVLAFTFSLCKTVSKVTLQI